MVHLSGFLNAGLGLGATGRHIHRLLELAGIPHECMAVPLPGQARAGSFPELAGPVETEAPLALLAMNGEHMQGYARQAGQGLFRDRRVIGVWFWETNTLPAMVVNGQHWVDEVWAFSPFVADTVRRCCPHLPVTELPYPIPLENSRSMPLESDHAYAWPGKHVYLFCFDFNSCVLRKNPRGVADAYVSAFPQPGSTLCVIKSINGHLHQVELMRLKRRFRHRPDLIFIDGFMESGCYRALLERADTYVSLHRSEGLGMTILEAMARGIPCIATGYSGNLAFMTGENSWLVPWTERVVGVGSLLYPADHVWAEPDIDSAAAAMKERLHHPELAATRVAAARRDLLANHDPAHVASLARAALQGAMARPPKAKRSLPAEGTWSAHAGAGLKALKQREESIRAMETGKPRFLQCRPVSPASGGWLGLAKSHHEVMASLLKALRENNRRQADKIHNLECRLARLEAHLAEHLAEDETGSPSSNRCSP